MISCDFAPNEQIDDAWLSFKLLFQPWRWNKKQEIEEIKNTLLKIFKVSRFTFHVSLFFSGRSALYFLLKSLNLPQRSEIIVQGFTCEAVVLPIIANNLRPVYADIESETYSLDPIDLKKKITKNTKAIILQHSFGLPPKFRKTIINVARQYRLLLIEDIAHGLSTQNSKLKAQNAIYLMSFGRSKALSSVCGGAVVINDNYLARRLKNFESKLPQPSFFLIIKLLLYKPLSIIIKYTYDLYLGKIIHKISNFLKILPPEITEKEKRGEYNHFWDKTYPNALAILLLHQLKKYQKTQQQRKKISQIYNKQFSVFSFQSLNHPFSRYPLLIKNRPYLVKQLEKYHIFLGQWYTQPVAPKSLNLKKVNYQWGSCPVAESLCQQIINLPTLIKIKESYKLINTFKKFNLKSFVAAINKYGN